jgi:hypothetical protein
VWKSEAFHKREREEISPLLSASFLPRDSLLHKIAHAEHTKKKTTKEMKSMRSCGPQKQKKGERKKTKTKNLFFVLFRLFLFAAKA